MKRLGILLMLLTACSPLPPTVGDLVEQGAHENCAKALGCGAPLYMDSYDACVAVTISDVCGTADCDAPILEANLEAHDKCLEAVDAGTCDPYTTPVICYTAWGIE